MDYDELTESSMPLFGGEGGRLDDLDSELLRLRKREADLVAERQMLRDILDAIPDTLVVHAKEGGIVFCNRQLEAGPWTHISGARNGKDCYQCHMGGDPHCICRDCYIDRVFQAGERQDLEMASPDRAHFRAITAFPVRNAQGDVSMVAEYVRDVSATRMMEEELRKAKEAAESADKAKSEFLASMSHEIRTPMNGVLGMLDLAFTTKLDEEQTEYLEAAQNSAESLLSLINDILDFSKIEAGMLQLEQQAFCLGKRLSPLQAMFHHRAEERGLNFTVTIDADVPDGLVGDPLRLRQVLVNLLENAFKFTDSGSISLHIMLREYRSDGVLLEFAVKDTGAGINEDYQKIIFQSFTQSPYSFSRKRQGSGLGLAICKRLTAVMGGDIWVKKSTPGQGSEFVFQAFFGTALFAEEEDKRCSKSPTTSGMKARILVAEDHPMNLMFIERFLQKQGYEVAHVMDGGEVVPALTREHFDLVLMDIAMPQMNGMEATHAVRQATGMKSSPNIPIIAMTAHAMKGDQEKFLEAGMDDYIGKPINSDNLRNLLIMHLQKNAEGK